MLFANCSKYFFFILIYIINTSAVRDDTRVFVTTISPYKILRYQAFYKELCLQPSEGYVEHLPELDYQWGYSYLVKLKETQLINPPQDASAFNYELLAIKKATQVEKDYTFKMSITSNVYLGHGETNPSSLVELNDTTFRYLDEVNILVSKKQLTKWNTLLGKDEDFKSEFKFEKQGYIRLVKL